jgi:hypothetical protein
LVFTPFLGRTRNHSGGKDRHQQNEIVPLRLKTPSSCNLPFLFEYIVGFDNSLCERGSVVTLPGDQDVPLTFKDWRIVFDSQMPCAGLVDKRGVASTLLDSCAMVTERPIKFQSK